MSRVVVFTAPGCHLCGPALDAVRSLCGNDFDVVDITIDAELERRYRTRIRSSRSTVSSVAATSSTRTLSEAPSERGPADRRPEKGLSRRIPWIRGWDRGGFRRRLRRRLDLRCVVRPNREQARADLHEVSVLRDPVEGDADLLEVHDLTALGECL